MSTVDEAFPPEYKCQPTETSGNLGQANAQYSSRVPTANFQQVPAYNGRDRTTLICTVRDIRHFNVDGVEPGAVRSIIADNFCATDKLQDWRWHKRHEAQMILPTVYLGSTMALRNREYLMNEKISLLLFIQDDNVRGSSSVFRPGKFTAGLDIESQVASVGSNLLSGYLKIVQIINDHLLRQNASSEAAKTALITPPYQPSTSGKVLVCCESGASRSAAMVVAYIMTMYGKNFVSATQLVMSQRQSVALDGQEIRALRSFEDIITAMVDTGKLLQVFSTDHNGLMTQPEYANATLAPRKRGVETLDMVNQQMADDETRFLGRTEFVPFRSD